MDVTDFANDPDLMNKIRLSLRMAEGDEEGRNLEIYITFKERNEKSRGIGKIQIDPKTTDAVKLRKHIEERLLSDLGGDAEGKLRIYFRFYGHSEDTIATMQRTLTGFEGENNGGETSDKLPRWAERFIARVTDTQIELVRANSEALKNAGEALKGSAEVIRAMNPQPDNWVQLVGAIAPLVIANQSQKKPPTNGNGPAPGTVANRPIADVEYVNQRTGRIIKMDGTGQWYERDDHGVWQRCEAPKDFPGLEPGNQGPPPALEAPKQENTDGLSDEALEQLLDDPERRRRLLRVFKKKAEAMGVKDPDMMGQALAGELRQVEE